MYFWICRLFLYSPVMLIWMAARFIAMKNAVIIITCQEKCPTLESWSRALILVKGIPRGWVSRMVRLYSFVSNLGANSLRLTWICTRAVSVRFGVPPSLALTRSCNTRCRLCANNLFCANVFFNMLYIGSKTSKQCNRIWLVDDLTDHLESGMREPNHYPSSQRQWIWNVIFL